MSTEDKKTDDELLLTEALQALESAGNPTSFLFPRVAIDDLKMRIKNRLKNGQPK